MRYPGHIFISPHRDDACFSLAASICLLGGGHLINIFTKSAYVSHPSLATQTPPLSADTVTALRNKEDEFFSETMNLERHELGLPEATLRGLSWNLTGGQINWEEEASEQATIVFNKLAPLLEQLISRNGTSSATLYFPMAIGGHRDHMAVLMAGKIIRSTSWGQRLHWLFYEDLPYASWPDQREEGIRRFQSIIERESITKRHLLLTPEQLDAKMKLVNIYASQHYTPPPRSELACHDSWRLGPHEALWEAY